MGIVGVPVGFCIVEHPDSRLAGMEGLSTTPVQSDGIGGFQSKGRVVGLDAVAPDAAVGAVHQVRMRVDWQE